MTRIRPSRPRWRFSKILDKLPCNYCGKIRELLRRSGGAAILLSDGAEKIRRSGDSGKVKLLCAECEQLFNFELDSPAIAFLRSYRNKINCGIDVSNACAAPLLLFVMSVVWRASRSTSPAYSGIQLPKKMENAFKAIIFDAKAVAKIASVRLEDLVDPAIKGGFSRDDLTQIILWPKARRPEKNIEISMAFGGFAFRVYLPKLSYPESKEPCYLRAKPSRIRARKLNVFHYPGFMDVCVQNRAKHEQGHVTF